MPPKVKITKEDIIEAAVELVRKSGAHALNARTIASMLGCSTQPVFSNFATMDQLRLAVAQRAGEICGEYMQKEAERGEFPPYKASGIGYIRFAKEESTRFALIYMRERAGTDIPVELELNGKMESMVHSNTGLGDDGTKLFHLEMWVFVHGIATMFATGFLDLPWDLVSKMLTDNYLGLRKQYGME